jgi:hypothetical protein
VGEENAGIEHEIAVGSQVEKSEKESKKVEIKNFPSNGRRGPSMRMPAKIFQR